MAQIQAATYDGNGKQLSTQIIDVPAEFANADTLASRATAALAANAAFLNGGVPTNLQIVAQVQALTRQVNALIRLRFGHTDDITGT